MGKLITIRFWYGIPSQGDKIVDRISDKAYRVKYNCYTGNQKPYYDYIGRVLVILDKKSICNIDDIIMIGKEYCKLIQILIDDEWMEISDMDNK